MLPCRALPMDLRAGIKDAAANVESSNLIPWQAVHDVRLRWGECSEVWLLSIMYALYALVSTELSPGARRTVLCVCKCCWIILRRLPGCLAQR